LRPREKLVGVVAHVAGAAAAILAIWMVQQYLTFRRLDLFTVGVCTALLIGVCFYCYLLVYGLLSPTVWRILAGFFWTMGLMLAAVVLWHHYYFALMAIPGIGWLGYRCLRAARVAQKVAAQMALLMSVPPVVFPPDTSLLTKEGFLPTGFICGIEILNDNVTRMEFVVLALREKLGMGKNESIDTMLGIHRNGGVLLPTSTTDEATRIADAIVADARAKDFPLICRAVSVVGS